MNETVRRKPIAPNKPVITGSHLGWSCNGGPWCYSPRVAYYRYKRDDAIPLSDDDRSLLRFEEPEHTIERRWHTRDEFGGSIHG